eukprot:scaffold80188_cov16-Tisochrysis_lutea.AAC.1
MQQLLVMGSFTAYIAVLPFTKPFSISSHWDSAILTQELPPEAPAPDVVPSPISNPRHPPGPDYIPPPHMPPDIEPPHVRPGTFPDIPSGPDMAQKALFERALGSGTMEKDGNDHWSTAGSF